MGECNCREPHVPALEHERDCPLRLSFFGGHAEWDQSRCHHDVAAGVIYSFDTVRGTWVPVEFSAGQEETDDTRAD